MDDQSIGAQTLKGWEMVLSWLFRYPSRCVLLKDPPLSETREMKYSPLIEFSSRYNRFNTREGILCKVTKSQHDVSLLSELIKDLPKEISDLTIAELLAKGYAYRTLYVGQSLQIQGAEYIVDEVFDLWNNMTAFGLFSRVKEPLLLFRGTDTSLLTESGRASIISDLDPQGPGLTMYTYAQDKIHSWLDKVASQGMKARAIGHSLGGAFVIYTLLLEAPLMHQTLPSYAFNYPGIPEDLALKWQLMNPSTRPAFKGIITRGDVVSKFGKLIEETYEASIAEPLLPIAAHEKLIFSEPLTYLHLVDIERENSSSSREQYSKIQQSTSNFIYQMGLKHLFPNQDSVTE
ncbi:MAG: hypothetical protein KBC64_01305 [Simkaniaceae bacterium]|nr:hypothetical protein [Simkaniaceae bacterium]